MTLQEIGLELGISTQRVSQIEQRALKKVRTKLKNRNITFWDLIECLKLY